MKKKLLLGLFTLFVCFSLTGCGEKEEEIKNSFTITCEGQEELMQEVKTTSKSVYNFDKNQMITDYEVITVNVYDNEETYNYYKGSTLETANNNDSGYASYDVKTDDTTKTLTFTYKVIITNEMIEQIEEEDFYKAINVLERAETNPNAKCTITGAEKSQLK